METDIPMKGLPRMSLSTYLDVLSTGVSGSLLLPAGTKAENEMFQQETLWMRLRQDVNHLPVSKGLSIDFLD